MVSKKALEKTKEYFREYSKGLQNAIEDIKKSKSLKQYAIKKGIPFADNGREF